MSFSTFMKRIYSGVDRNLPTILTWCGVGGVAGTIFSALKAGEKAPLIMEQLRDEYATEEPPKKEVFKRMFPVYLPTVLAGSFTVACIIGANNVSTKRNVVLAGLYSASEFALKEYQKKIVDTLGEKKEQFIHDEIARERMERTPVSDSQVIITGGGETLCFDSWSGRYFKSDAEKIKRAENTINREVIIEMWVPVNQLYYELGLSPVKSGEDVGWDNDHMLDFRFSSHLAEDDRPCLVIDYEVNPKYI